MGYCRDCQMSFIGYIASALCLSFVVFILVKGVAKYIRNDRGWRRVEADRKAQGKPFYGEMEEELEKEMYDIWD